MQRFSFLIDNFISLPHEALVIVRRTISWVDFAWLDSLQIKVSLLGYCFISNEVHVTQ